MNGIVVDNGVIELQAFRGIRSAVRRNRHFETRYPVMVREEAAPYGKPKLLDQLRQALRARHYSPKTETAYVIWVRRFILFHDVRHPVDMGEEEINAFLTHLAVKGNVSASTQNQALSALLFLYRYVIGRKVGDLGEVVRARKPVRLPVVMTRDEVNGVLANLTGDKWIMASLMYGAGLRLSECLQLRVQNIDFSKNEIMVRDGKGAKDRITMLPESLKTPLVEHLKVVKAFHEEDLSAGWGRVLLPDALDRKYPNAATEWRWQWVFSQKKRWKNSRTGEEGRHHMDESLIQRAVKKAVSRAGLTKRATCHTSLLRHPFARRRVRHSDSPGTSGTQRCEDNDDIHTRAESRTVWCCESPG